MKKATTELIRGFARDERGATAIEYALIASIISISIAAVAVTLGETVRDQLFGRVSNALGS
jgi:pilus assembly protein Flp/PilA